MLNLKINLKHLRYFWSVASHGSIAKAAATLYLTPQTISGQLRDLEQQIGAKLFRRDGRNLVLTDTGHPLIHEGFLHWRHLSASFIASSGV